MNKSWSRVMSTMNVKTGKNTLIKRYTEKQWLVECRRRKHKSDIQEILNKKVSVKKTILRKNPLNLNNDQSEK